MEAATGFEPVGDGFANRCLGPLGYAAPGEGFLEPLTERRVSRVALPAGWVQAKATTSRPHSLACGGIRSVAATGILLETLSIRDGPRGFKPPKSAWQRARAWREDCNAHRPHGPRGDAVMAGTRRWPSRQASRKCSSILSPSTSNSSTTAFISDRNSTAPAVPAQWGLSPVRSSNSWPANI